ncbi:GIY-YIg catalytic domain-containing endonuclease [Faustovirus]|nr:GIY-YIg catalytic domain-containing endonuclease [Faustovirus]
MGIIYKITFPNEANKAYIGQTTKTFDQRMAGHKSSGNNEDKKDGCRALNAAIRKYGWDNCIREILKECPDEELDDWEKHYIKEFNTLSPGGYNLTVGGNSKKFYSDETKKLISDRAKERDITKYRKQEETKDLPKYISIWNSPDGKIGFRIKRHPKCPCKTFMDKNKTLEQNKQDAIDFLAKLESGEVPEVIIPEKEYPKGMHSIRNKAKEVIGYRVVYTDKAGKRHVRQFLDQSVKLDIRETKALKYINDLIQKDITTETPRISADKTA